LALEWITNYFTEAEYFLLSLLLYAKRKNGEGRKEKEAHAQIWFFLKRHYAHSLPAEIIMGII